MRRLYARQARSGAVDDDAQHAPARTGASHIGLLRVESHAQRFQGLLHLGDETVHAVVAHGPTAGEVHVVAVAGVAQPQGLGLVGDDLVDAAHDDVRQIPAGGSALRKEALAGVLVDQGGPADGEALPGGLQVHVAVPGATVHPGLVRPRWRHGDQPGRGVGAQGAADTTQADLRGAVVVLHEFDPVLRSSRAGPRVLQSRVDMPLPDAPEEVGDVQADHGVGPQMDCRAVHDRAALAIGECCRVRLEPGWKSPQTGQDLLLHPGQSRDGGVQGPQSAARLGYPVFDVRVDRAADHRLEELPGAEIREVVCRRHRTAPSPLGETQPTSLTLSCSTAPARAAAVSLRHRVTSTGLDPWHPV